MIMPLDELIDFKGNRYELACAAIKRATQIIQQKSKEKEDDLSSANGKLVSLAIRQVLTGKVKYKLEDR